MRFLTAAWHDLIMVTWRVPPDILGPYVADGTELDLWEGHALASLVAFDFRDTRVLGVPIPFHTRFPEVNLRFYVRRRAPQGEWRRGVSFVQELVPRAAIAWVARTLYGEPYLARPMRRVAIPERPITTPASRSEFAADGDSRTLSYEWKRDGTWERVRAITRGAAQPMRSGSIEEFLAEHYWGYTRRPGRPTMEYQVEHPRWNVYASADCTIDADLRTLYGPQFADVLAAPPVSQFVADGSPVAVYAGQPIPSR